MKKYVLFLTVMATSMANMAIAAGAAGSWIKELNDMICKEGADGVVNGMCYKLKYVGKSSPDVDKYELKCAGTDENIYYFQKKGEWCKDGFITYGFCSKDSKELIGTICTGL